MKIIILIVILGCVCLVACRPRNKTTPPIDLAPLVKALHEEEFFKYVAEVDVSGIQQSILDEGYLFPEQLNRVFFADSEYLAEGGVLSFITEISPFLEKQGVHIPLRQDADKRVNTRNPNTGEVISVNTAQWVTDDSIPDEPGKKFIRPISEDFPGSGDYYRVTIGDHSMDIWNRSMTPVQCWEASTCHTFLLINQMLEKSGSNERVYGLYGGNDGYALFLTQEQFDLINRSSILNDADKPWKPYKVNE